MSSARLMSLFNKTASFVQEAAVNLSSSTGASENTHETPYKTETVIAAGVIAGLFIGAGIFVCCKRPKQKQKQQPGQRDEHDINMDNLEVDMAPQDNEEEPSAHYVTLNK